MIGGVVPYTLPGIYAPGGGARVRTTKFVGNDLIMKDLACCILGNNRPMEYNSDMFRIQNWKQTCITLLIWNIDNHQLMLVA